MRIKLLAVFLSFTLMNCVALDVLNVLFMIEDSFEEAEHSVSNTQLDNQVDDAIKQARKEYFIEKRNEMYEIEPTYNIIGHWFYNGESSKASYSFLSDGTFKVYHGKQSPEPEEKIAIGDTLFFSLQETASGVYSITPYQIFMQFDDGKNMAVPYTISGELMTLHIDGKSDNIGWQKADESRLSKTN